MLQGKRSLRKDVTLYKQPNVTGALVYDWGPVRINTVAHLITRPRVHQSGYISVSLANHPQA